MDSVPNQIELEQAFEKSFEREPVSYSWGFFAYDDSPGAAGGGAGNFSWFETKEDMVGFLRRFPLLAHSSVATDLDRFTAAKEFMANSDVDDFDQKSVEKFNKLVVGIEQIQWLGQLNDLLSGETEFAEGMRKFFAGSTKILSKSQIPEFVVFLKNWGH
ncbi:MAG TPA: hypothetical protein V6C76_14220 [Drouetiella sp.]